MTKSYEPVTAEQIWQLHRAALEGKSAITGAQLPVRLEDCPTGVQASHHGIALGIAIMNAPRGVLPERPPGVTALEARRIERLVRESIRGV